MTPSLTLVTVHFGPDSLLVIPLKNDDDDLEDIFQSVRDIREHTPLREYPERPELNRGLSGTDLDGQESESDQKSPQLGCKPTIFPYSEPGEKT